MQSRETRTRLKRKVFCDPGVCVSTPGSIRVAVAIAFIGALAPILALHTNEASNLVIRNFLDDQVPHGA